MATNLGNAYVQIIPSAKGITGSISRLLNPEAKAAGASVGRGLGGKIASVAGKAIAAAGIGKALASSIRAGGALEQSIGGVETLFKDSANIVKNYAKQAYKTSGVSANQYMQQATSFSASLLQSLGGDTKAAAKTADMAIRDMSDKQTVRLKRIEPYQGCAYANKKLVCADGETLNYLKVA